MDKQGLLYGVIALAPLFGAIVAGLFGKAIGRVGAHRVTIAAVGVSAALSLLAYKRLMLDGGEVYNRTFYTWLSSGGLRLETGFLIDPLSVTMMAVVSCVSLLIHIYTIGYMRDDPGYQRFFCYLSLFTFAMLMLVMSNNFMQLFFGWEAVGLVSYLLIGFWFKRESAARAGLKAFLVNRVGDFAFLLGIAAVLLGFGTLDYAAVFARAPEVAAATTWIGGREQPLLTVICLCLFIGAMGKSAQVPLHVWLPDSMEGPTPISALIHAATMVTAGIFMVARMSPLYEFAAPVLSVILIVGALTAFFTGLLALAQHDIKRVIAYSTLSQLGYMTVALGASAYAAGIFHLVTHAFFKALLFLAAGSVIIAMRHEQDMRKMGGLYRYLPITWFTALIGALSLSGFPGLAGFYSKDGIIAAAQRSAMPGAEFAYYAVLAAVFVTALYTFRMFFLTFHGKERLDRRVWERLRESPAVVTAPLLLLAIPSVFAGAWLIGDMLFGEYFGDAIYVANERDVLYQIGYHYKGVARFTLEAFLHPPVYLSLAGIFTAWLLYIRFPAVPPQLAVRLRWLHTPLRRKYYFDEVYEFVFAAGCRRLGKFLWRLGDVRLIDGLLVNGAATAVRWCAGVIRHLQSGYLYDYAFTMIIGLLLLLAVFAHGVL